MAKMVMKNGPVLFSAEGSEEFLTREREAAMPLFTQPVNDILPQLKLYGEIIKTDTAPVMTGAVKFRRVVERPMSLAFLKKAVEDGCGKNVIHPFDELEIALTDGRTATAVCMGFDPEGVHPFFVFKDCLGKGPMNDSPTNRGGYYKSKGRRYVLEDLYNLLPPELRAIIRPRELVEIIDGEEKRYSDPLWLPSATDVFGPSEGRWWADEADSFQFEAFKRERDRVKEYLDDPDYGTCNWWLRSPYATDATSFCIVGTDGYANYHNAYFSNGFAPGFCV